MALLIKKSTDHNIQPLNCEASLNVSAMQKAIRRGDEKTALSAAVTLYHQNYKKFWNRLHITAVEDVGIGCLEAVKQTLYATANTAWRKKRGDLNTALPCVKALCAAPKSRIADHIVSVAQYGAEYAGVRDELFQMNISDLNKIIDDGHADPVTRCLALWLLVGTKRYMSDILPYREGDVTNAEIAFHRFNIDPMLRQSCVALLKRTQYPLVMFTPILFEYAREHKLETGSRSFNDDYIEGVPLYALDQFTHIGKSCYRSLKNKYGAFKAFTVKQIGMAVFYCESDAVNTLASNPFLNDLREQSMFADLSTVGLDMEHSLGLMDILAEYWTELQDIRREDLTHYLKERSAS